MIFFKEIFDFLAVESPIANALFFLKKCLISLLVRLLSDMSDFLSGNC